MNARQSVLLKVENMRHKELIKKCDNDMSKNAEICRHIVKVNMILNKEKGLSL